MMGRSDLTARLGGYQPVVDAALDEIGEQKLLERIWRLDHTVWKPQPDEITNRLGWLNSPVDMRAEIPRLQALAQSLQEEGYTHALLLGMGGSSLAPEVLAKTFGVREGCLDLSILDSTDPGAVLATAKKLPPSRTLYIVSTKSGGTVETLSFFKYFYNYVIENLGREGAGRHFIAITDPGSSLAELGARYQFRQVYLNNPDIGGRYSALSLFGLLPAALIGLDISILLERARGEAQASQDGQLALEGGSRAAQLGAILGELARRGRDKVTLITSPSICSFGDWIEQLVAESTGKEGQGILPVVGEPPGSPESFGNDRLFVYLRLAGDHTHDIHVLALEAGGHPLVTLELADMYDLGSQFFLWEMATIIAGARLGINPFDQPNVEAAKVLARKMVSAYQAQGSLPGLPYSLQTDHITVFGKVPADSLGGTWENLLSLAQPGAYISIQAYIQPTPESDAALLELRRRLRDATRLAVTTGYGPRFLHSTGQLHKGDAGRGLFVQLVNISTEDAAIPDQAGQSHSSMSFGVLKEAQALGDYQALVDSGREVMHFRIEGDLFVGLSRLTKAIEL